MKNGTLVERLRMEEGGAGLGVEATDAMTPEDELKQRYFYSRVRETIVRGPSKRKFSSNNGNALFL